MTIITNTVSEQPVPLKGELVYLASEDIRLAASLLFQAYRDDPLFRSIFNAEKDGYEQRLRAAIREELFAFWHSQQPMFGFYHNETLEGVVCLTRPGDNFGPGRFWHWRLKMLLTAGYVSTKQMVEKERLITEAMPKENYHMLAFIAVHPRYQQQGLGDLLVAAVDTELEQHSDSEGVAVFVTRPEYERFFEQRDYKVIEEIQVDEIAGKLMFRARSA